MGADDTKYLHNETKVGHFILGAEEISILQSSTHNIFSQMLNFHNVHVLATG